MLFKCHVSEAYSNQTPFSHMVTRLSKIGGLKAIKVVDLSLGNIKHSLLQLYLDKGHTYPYALIKYIYIYIYTYVHIYIHTYICIWQRRWLLYLLGFCSKCETLAASSDKHLCFSFVAVGPPQ